MSDVAYQGPNETAPPPPPPPKEPVGVPIEQRIDRPIDLGSDEENIREATRQMREREREWESGVGPDVFEAQRAPILERKYDGRDHEPKSLKQATKDLSDRHWVERPETEILRSQGWTDEQIRGLGKNEEWLIKQVGYTPQEAAEYARRGEAPPIKISPVRDDGKLVKPLHDDEPITLDDAFKSRSELKRSVKNFRQATAEAQARLLAELSAQDQQQVASDQQTAVEQAQPAASESAQPTPQQQPDPATLERMKLQAERAHYNEARRFSAVETQAASQIEALNALAQQYAPELFNKDALAEVAKTNPARLEQLKQANAYLQSETKAAQQKWQQARASRQAAEAQITAQQHAEIRARWHQYKDAEDSKFHQFTPEMNDPVKASAMRQGVQAMLHEIGFGKEELNRAWNGESGFSVRDHRAQRLIADAYRWRQAQANARNIANKRAPVPPVVRPGTFRPAGADGAEQISRIERELESATGARAVKLATQLHQARRSAGY
jgi:hypothetical protein